MEENQNQNQNQTGMTVKGVDALQDNNCGYTPEIFTSIQDPKLLFNLETSIDFLLNDMVGSVIKITDFLIKIIEIPLREPKRKTVLDKETGEIIETDEMITSERIIITILVDNEGKSYLTKSKNFFFACKKLLSFYPVETIKEGIDIKIKKIKSKTGNYTLTLEIV